MINVRWATDWLLEEYGPRSICWRVSFLAIVAASLYWGLKTKSASAGLTPRERKMPGSRLFPIFWVVWLRSLPLLVLCTLIFLMFPLAPPTDVMLVSRARNSFAEINGPATQQPTFPKDRRSVDAGPLVDEVLRALPNKSVWTKSDPNLISDLEGPLSRILVTRAPNILDAGEPSKVCTNGVDLKQFPAWLIESVEFTTMRLLGRAYNVREFYVAHSDRRTSTGVPAWALAEPMICTRPIHHMHFIPLSEQYPASLLSIAGRQDSGNGTHIALTCEFEVAEQEVSGPNPVTVALTLHGRVGGVDKDIQVSTVPFVRRESARIEIQSIGFDVPPSFEPRLLEQGSPSRQLDVPTADAVSTAPPRIGLRGAPGTIDRWAQTLQRLRTDAMFHDCAQYIRSHVLKLDAVAFEDASAADVLAGCDVLIDVDLDPVIAIYSRAVTRPSVSLPVRDLPRPTSPSLLLRGFSAPFGVGLRGRFGWDNIPLLPSHFHVLDDPPPATDVLVRQLSGTLATAHREDGKAFACIWRTLTPTSDQDQERYITWIGFDPADQGCLEPLGVIDESRFSSFWTSIFRGVVLATKKVKTAPQTRDPDAPMLLLNADRFDELIAADRRSLLMPLMAALFVYAVFTYRGIASAPGNLR